MWKKIIIDNIETNYSVSDDGQVRNDKRNLLLKQYDDNEYKVVSIAINPKKLIEKEYIGQLRKHLFLIQKINHM